MSSVAISGDTSGAITLTAPLVAGTNTITLPASTGTMALTSQLGGMTLLGTITTNSGTGTVSLSGLDLTGYHQLQCQFSSVTTSGSGRISINGNTASGNLTSANGFFLIDLTTGLSTAILGQLNSVTGATNFFNTSGLTTASTSISFTSSSTFSSGSILVYGIY